MRAHSWSVHEFCSVVLLWIFLGASSVFSQPGESLLGVRLGPELAGIVKEIEVKTGKKVFADFDEQPEFQLGSSFIEDDSGRAVILIDPALEKEPKKLEAVLAHELLHLRLRVRGFPSFIFSPTVRTAKGRAIDVEQSNINDLRSMIEHRVFRTEMERFGLYQFIDLAGDTAAVAKNKKGQEDGQADSINYARALLEYRNAKDIALVADVYKANGWARSLAEGRALADIISQSSLTTPGDVESVFRRCLVKLYPLPAKGLTFQLTPDRTNKYFLRLVVSIARAGKK